MVLVEPIQCFSLEIPNESVFELILVSYKNKAISFFKKGEEKVSGAL